MKKQRVSVAIVVFSRVGLVFERRALAAEKDTEGVRETAEEFY